MGIGNLNPLGGNEQVTNLNKTNGNQQLKAGLADPALGRAIREDTVSFSCKPDVTPKNNFEKTLQNITRSFFAGKKEEVSKTDVSALQTSQKITEEKAKTEAGEIKEGINIQEEYQKYTEAAKGKKDPISFEDFKNLYNNAISLADYAADQKNDFITNYLEKFPGDKDETHIYETSSRSKSADSIQKKLTKKFEKGKITDSSSKLQCNDQIGDLLGGRLTIGSLSSSETDKILENFGLTQTDCINYILGKVDNINGLSGEAAEEKIKAATASLKEAQTQGMVDKLCELIETHEIEVFDTFNNYGSNGTSYFTDAQIQKIADTQLQATGVPLQIVSKINPEDESGHEMITDKGNDRHFISDGEAPGVYKMYNDNGDEVGEINTQGSEKNSGYSASQFNIKCKDAEGNIYNAELQVRGSAVNVYAEGEHVIYDILSGKTLPDDPKHGKECRLINSLNDNDKNTLTDCLKYAYAMGRIYELGLEPGKIDFDQFRFENKEKESEIKAMLSEMFPPYSDITAEINAGK